MKTFCSLSILGFLLLLLGAGCVEKKPERSLPYTPLPTQPGTVVISGQTTFVKESFQREVRLWDDLLGTNFPLELAMDTLDENGRFRLTAPLDRARELFFSFNDRRIALLLAPGDELELNFPADYFTGLSRAYTVLEVEGKGALKNRLMLDFLTLFQERFDNRPGIGQRWMMGEEEWIQFWTEMENKQYHLLDSFVLAQAGSDPAFEQWARHKIFYDIAYSLTRYPAIRGNRQKGAIPISEEFESQINRRFSSDPSAVASQSFLRAANAYRDHLLGETSRAPFGRTADPYTRFSSAEMRKRLDKIAQLPIPFLRELLTAQFIDIQLEMDEWPVFESHCDSILGRYADVALVRYLDKKKTLCYDVPSAPSLPEDVHILEMRAGQALDSFLAKQYEGRLICLTQWTSWERNWGLENMSEAVRKHPDVAFVYLAHHSPPGRWLHRLNESAYRGDHLLLLHEDYQAIDSFFIRRDRRQYHRIINREGVLHKSDRWLFGEYLSEELAALKEQ
ncbi:MAG: hypothetical protein AAFV95_13485 [Bacteroidota bacterium]